jgi:hypothetical protein
VAGSGVDFCIGCRIRSHTAKSLKKQPLSGPNLRVPVDHLTARHLPCLPGTVPETLGQIVDLRCEHVTVSRIAATIAHAIRSITISLNLRCSM